MKRLLFVWMLALAARAFGETLITPQDSCGIVVTLREKYGPVFEDSGVVLSIWNNNFVLTKKDEASSFYPMTNYSITKTRRISCVK